MYVNKYTIAANAARYCKAKRKDSNEKKCKLGKGLTGFEHIKTVFSDMLAVYNIHVKFVWLR